MNEELMRQNLENNRYQSSSVVDNILTIGIANSALENSIKNSLAKTSSASFQMALKNGGIYHNNALLGSSNMYRFARWITGGRFSNGKSEKVFGLGRYEVNKFSAGQLDPKKYGVLNDIGKNISSNAKDWDINSDIIPTGYGVQNSGYKEFFNQLEDIGFSLEKSLSPEVNLTKEEYEIYQGIKNKDAKYSYVTSDSHKKIIESEKSIDEFANKKYDSKISNATKKSKELRNKVLDEKGNYLKNADEYEILDYQANTSEAIKLSNAKRIEVDKLRKEYKAVQYIDDEINWNSKNLSDDLYNSLKNNYSKIAKNDFNLNNADDSKRVQTFMDDFFNLEKTFNKFGKRTTSEFNKIYSLKSKELAKKLKMSNIKKYAKQNNITISEAMSTLKKDVMNELSSFVKDNIDDAFRNLGDDVGVHFAKRTVFQKFIGNKGMQFLSGVKAGTASFLWQLPAMVVSATASINQDNAVQNFVSSYLYNPKTKEMYNSSAVNKSMQISQNIHYSNLQDSQNIIIKHNTAERYLNDLDPIKLNDTNITSLFDLNPRNE